MKIIEKKIINEEQEVIVDIICNSCGATCWDCHKMNYEGLTEAEVIGGYGSSYIGDGISYTFSICEKCLIEKIFVAFKIQPEKHEEPWLGQMDQRYEDD